MTIAAETVTRADPLVRYGPVLGCLLFGYLMFDRAFAYLHLPGTPLFIGEIALALGVVAVARSTGVLRATVAAEPILSLLAVFMLWGAIRTVPGVAPYGVDAVRDAALWYYALFAFLAAASVAARPQLPGLMATQLRRWSPLVLAWLAVTVVLAPFEHKAPTVPFTEVSVLSHKAGGAATAAMLVLAVLWLPPGPKRQLRRAALSCIALLVIALIATQNRGSLIGILAGGMVGLAFVADRMRVVGSAIVTIGIAMTLSLLLPVEAPFPGWQGREYSARQLVTNVVSLTGAGAPEGLEGTVDARKELWTRVLDKQVSERRVLVGAGFGPNLAAEVYVFDEGTDSLRNPHNTHLSVLARMGAWGALMWAMIWGAWYWRVGGASRRLRHTSRHADAQMGGVCLVGCTAVLVAAVFDPLLEGPQVAVLLWSLFGMGLAVTGPRT